MRVIAENFPVGENPGPGWYYFMSRMTPDHKEYISVWFEGSDRDTCPGAFCYWREEGYTTEHEFLD